MLFAAPMIMLFLAESPPPALALIAPLGVVIRETPDRLQVVVQKVVPGSLAESIGIRMHDVLIYAKPVDGEGHVGEGWGFRTIRDVKTFVDTVRGDPSIRSVTLHGRREVTGGIDGIHLFMDFDADKLRPDVPPARPRSPFAGPEPRLDMFAGPEPRLDLRPDRGRSPSPVKVAAEPRAPSPVRAVSVTARVVARGAVPDRLQIRAQGETGSAAWTAIRLVRHPASAVSGRNLDLNLVGDRPEGVAADVMCSVFAELSLPEAGNRPWPDTIRVFGAAGTIVECTVVRSPGARTP